MLRFNPSWYSRIFRNAEPEVHVTVIESPPVPEVVVSQPVADAVQGAAQIAALADSISKADPELLAALSGIQETQRVILDRLGLVESTVSNIDTKVTVAAVSDIVEEIEEEITEAPIVELPREEIPPAPVAPTEEPKKRGRRWI